MSIIVTNPSEKHVNQMVSLADEARQHHIAVLGGYFKPIIPAIELDIIHKYMEPNENHIIMIALDANDNVLGMILGDILDKPWLVCPKVGHVANLIVSVTARRKGIGKMLMDAFVSKCKKCGVQEITLGVYNKNKDSYNFYIKYGFEPSEQRMSIKL